MLQTLQTVTPSFVPTTEFGQMAQERRGLLDSIADIAQKAADVATVIKSPAGYKIESLAPPPAAQTPFASITNFALPNLIRNPVVIAGAALALVYFLKK